MHECTFAYLVSSCSQPPIPVPSLQLFQQAIPCTSTSSANTWRLALEPPSAWTLWPTSSQQHGSLADWRRSQPICYRSQCPSRARSTASWRVGCCCCLERSEQAAGGEGGCRASHLDHDRGSDHGEAAIRCLVWRPHHTVQQDQEGRPRVGGILCLFEFISESLFDLRTNPS